LYRVGRCRRGTSRWAGEWVGQRRPAVALFTLLYYSALHILSHPNHGRRDDQVGALSSVTLLWVLTHRDVEGVLQFRVDLRFEVVQEGTLQRALQTLLHD
jgi:hypothetical protein